jgi:hypothetical protein
LTVRTAYRHRCSLDISVHCAKGPGKPTRKKCRHCGGRFVVESGVYGVFRWRGDGDYPESRAVSLHAGQAAADHAAQTAGEEFVSRWIRRELVIE